MTRATVVAYHAVGDCPPADDPHELWVATEAFARQMAYLARARQVVPLADLVRGAVRGGRPAVAITFDDGYRSVLETAAPVLQRHGLPATVFVPTRYVGDRNRWDPPSGCPLEIMTADELRRAQGAGVAVESHGHAHLDLSDASYDEAAADLAPSMEALADITGRRPQLLAYPFRTGSVGAQQAAVALGFDAAFTVDLRHRGRYLWGRVAVTPHDDDRVFAWKTSGWWLGLRHHPVLSGAYARVRRGR